MSRKSLPDEDWTNEYSRRGQAWIHDKFFAEDGIEAFFPETTNFELEWGFKLSDLNRVFDDAKTVRMAMDTLVKLGDHLYRVAQHKADEGLEQTAMEYYHRAGLCYSRAQWSILDEDSEDKHHLHGRCVECFDRVREYNPYYEIDRVEIDLPFTDTQMPALFHRAGDENAPTVLFVPGMDMVKEQLPNPLDNRFYNRGMNVLVIDGPGQGEARLRGICDDEHDKYQRAGRAAVDWLVDQPEVDADRIGVFGWSMGSYWAPRVAHEDNRLSALAVALGTFYSKDLIFEQAQPFFKERFMYMAGITDEDEFDEFTEDMTLHGIDEQIDVPTFIAHGEYDELQTREQGKRFFDMLSGPKHLQLYENQFHPLGGVSADMLCDVADWFSRVFAGDIADDHEEAMFVPDYPNESYVPYGDFDDLETPEWD